MNSVIVHVCVIFVTVLVVHSSCRRRCDGQGAVRSAPFIFSYPNWEDIEWKVRLNLRNLSPDVSYRIDMAWIYETGNKQEKMKTKSKTLWTTQEYEKYQCLDLSIKKIDKDNNINMVTVYLALETKVGCCKNITIIQGKAFSTNNQVNSGYKRFESCFRSEPCTIVMDLANECTGSSTKPSETKATTTTAGDTSSTFITESVEPWTMPPGIVDRFTPLPDPNYFNINPTTSDSDVTTTTNKYIETISTRMSGNGDNKTEKQSQPSQDLLIYVIPPVIVLCVIILVMYIYVKKYRHRNSDQVDTIELKTYDTANDVVYADLNLAHGDSPPRREEDSTYAQIIGVIRPVHGSVINN